VKSSSQEYRPISRISLKPSAHENPCRNLVTVITKRLPFDQEEGVEPAHHPETKG
jgi:hypothetical protein